MRTYTPSDAPGRLEHRLASRSVLSAVVQSLPGMLAGAMPVLAVWLRLSAVGVLAFCLTSFRMSYGFYSYQCWESSRNQDWSFIQWGEYIPGAKGAGGATSSLTSTHLF